MFIGKNNEIPVTELISKKKILLNNITWKELSESPMLGEI